MASRAAAIASGSFSASRPPARASVSRPPPPPPTLAAAALTTSSGPHAPFHQRRGHAGDQVDPPIARAAQHDRGVAELALEPVGEFEQRLGVGARHGARPGRAPRRTSTAADGQLVEVEPGGRALALSARAFQLADPLAQLGDGVGNELGGYPERPRRVARARVSRRRISSTAAGPVSASIRRTLAALERLAE